MPPLVLHITRSIDPVGGCEIYIQNLIKISLRHGYQIHLLTAHAPKEFTECPITTIPQISSYEHKTAKESIAAISEALQAIKPDLIHIHDLNNPYVIRYCGENYPTIKTTLNADAYCGGTDKYLYTSGKECRFRLGFGCLPIAYYQNCMSRHPKRSLEIISIKKQSLEALRSISRAVVPSHRSQEILTHEGVPSDKISVIPLFAFKSNQPPAPYPKNAPPILFLGRLRAYKGVSYLLRAFQKMKQKTALEIVGDGEERKNLEKLARELKIEERVRFLGNQPHEKMNEYLDRCAMLVVPSVYPDSFPTVGLEAMARARPVIGFSIGGIPEWLLDNKTGFLTKTQDVDSLSEKMDYLLTHPDTAEAMGLEGKRRSDELFTEEPHMRLVNQLYTAVCSKFSKLQTSAR